MAANFSSAKPGVWLQQLSPKFLSSVYSQSLGAPMTQNPSYSKSFAVHERKRGFREATHAQLEILSVNSHTDTLFPPKGPPDYFSHSRTSPLPTALLPPGGQAQAPGIPHSGSS